MTKSIKQGAIQRRKTQNREAQRRFRDKQARLAQQSKEDFDKLLSQCDALLQENEVLKKGQEQCQDYTFSCSSLKGFISHERDVVDDVPLLRNDDNTSNSISLDIGIDKESTDNTEHPQLTYDQELSMTPFTPVVADISDLFPTMPDLSDITATPETSNEMDMQSMPQMLDLPEIGMIGPYSDGSLGSSSIAASIQLSELDYMNNVHVQAPSQLNLVQAMIQIACIQERIAQIELEKLKLHTWHTTRHQKGTCSDCDPSIGSHTRVEPWSNAA